MEFFDKYINPIHLLGLRSHLRTKRFLYTFNLTILLMIGAMLLGFFFMSMERMATASIGKSLFMIFSIMQYIVVSLVFPAFSCTAIISEKEGKTYDLLVTANLSPSDIVWGKFLSAFTHCAMFLISSLPVVMMAFLFGGITPDLLAITYGVLFAYSALIVMLCLAISSIYKTITRAIIASYVVIIVLNSFVSPVLFYLLVDYLYFSEISRFFISIGGYGSLNVFLTIYIMPPFLFFSLIFAPYLVAKNSLRTYANNRSTALRAYFVIFGTSLLAIFLTYYINTIFSVGQKLDYEMIIVSSGFCFGVVGLLSLIGAIGFAGENAVPEKFVMKRLSEYLKAGRIRKIFNWKLFITLLGPGSYRGGRFVCTMSILWMLIFLVGTMFLVESLGIKNNRFFKKYTHSYIEQLAISGLVVFSFTYFFCMLSTFLSFRIKQAGFRRAILFCISLFLVVLLPLYALFYMEAENYFGANLANLQYLSPSLCFGLSLAPVADLKTTYYNYLIYEIPLHYYHIFIYLFIGVIFHFQNRRSSLQRWKKLEEEEQEILNMK
ncbi:ABC transporter permease [Candidatus Uabimicrobium sp. HlEnr_7]|uniref:ABC transporter permease n=1 Tax=Candidatus Uabimicrobium helgolandensis TaxID=3095367 RepID=UPI00355640B5